MMRFVYGCLLFLFSVAWMSIMFAQDNKPVSAIPPDGFQFTGTWNCIGEFRNAKIHKATFTGSTILGGKWLELIEQDIEPATGYLAKYLIGYVGLPMGS